MLFYNNLIKTVGVFYQGICNLNKYPKFTLNKNKKIWVEKSFQPI